MNYEVCEAQFIVEDPRHRGYSLIEIDVYQWIPKKAQYKYNERNHRLTLWKNLKTGEYEVIKVFKELITQDFDDGTLFMHKETGEPYKIYVKGKDLNIICEEISDFYYKMHHFEDSKFTACCESDKCKKCHKYKHIGEHIRTSEFWNGLDIKKRRLFLFSMAEENVISEEKAIANVQSDWVELDSEIKREIYKIEKS